MKYIKIFLFPMILLLTIGNLFAVFENEYKKKIEFKKDVYKRTKQFIEENPGSSNMAELYFNLAELSTEIDESNPLLTSSYFEQVLNYDSNFIYKDVVIYNIAYFNFKGVKESINNKRLQNLDKAMNWPDSLKITEDKIEKTLGYYSVIYNDYPDSDYNSEAAYRLGMVYYDLALDADEPVYYLDKALVYFDDLATRENDNLQVPGLFQRGWTFFANNKYELAIEDFSKILGIIGNDNNFNYQTYFESSSIENIAHSLLQYDSDYENASIAAEMAINTFNSILDEHYGKQILREAVQLKLQYSAPLQAIDFYNAYLNLYPLSIECPLIIDSIIVLYSNNSNILRDNIDPRTRIISEWERLTSEYNSNSKWYNYNTNNEIDKPLQIIKNAFLELETRYFNLAYSKLTDNSFSHYYNLVQNYFEFDQFNTTLDFEKNRNIRKRLADLSFLISENNHNPYYYVRSRDLYYGFLTYYPDSDEKFEFEQKAFSGIETIYSDYQVQLKVAPFIDSLYNFQLDTLKLDSIYIRAAKRFEPVLEQDEFVSKQTLIDLIRILKNRASIHYSQKDYNEAFLAYEKLLSLNPDKTTKKLSYQSMGFICFEQKNYVDAENYYRYARDLADKSEKDQLEDFRIASIQANAEQKYSENDFIGASDTYLLLAQEDKINEVAYKEKAINSFMQGGNNQKAIDLYIDIANSLEDQNKVYKAYSNAWAISDSIPDFDQSIALRRQFINRFENSNQAFKVELQIINFYENDPYYLKEKAAEMYLNLHSKRNSMDFGSEKPERIYLKAISLYQETNNPDQKISHMLSFEKLYPENPRSIEFLRRVAFYYQENDMQKELNSISRYIFKKDPTSTLYSDLASNKLRLILIEADSLFSENNEKEIQLLEVKYNNLVKGYKDDGLTNLPYEIGYEQFETYNSYFDFYHTFDQKLHTLESDILAKSADQLIRVNDKTTFKEHLIGGKKRIPKLVREVKKESKELIDLVVKGSDNFYNLPLEKRSYAIYLAASINEYASDVINIQIQKYLSISRELNNFRDNETSFNKAKNYVLLESKKHWLESKKQAANYYNTLVSEFFEKAFYTDRWTEIAYSKLVEWKLRDEFIYENFVTDQTWNWNRFEINQSEIDDPSVWSGVISIPTDIDDVYFSDAQSLVIDMPRDFFLKKTFYSEIKPERMVVKYIYNNEVEIFINGQVVDVYQVSDSVLVDDYTHQSIIVTESDLSVNGENEIIFKISRDSTSISTEFFTAGIKLFYDKEKYDFAKTTEIHRLHSDENWRISTSLIENNSVMYNDLVKAIEAYHELNKNQIMGLENSSALYIEPALEDSLESAELFYYRKFDINNEAIKSHVTVYCSETFSFWVNNELIGEDLKIILDPSGEYYTPYSFDDIPLRKGENEVIIKVNNDNENNGILFDMKYFLKKDNSEE